MDQEAHINVCFALESPELATRRSFDRPRRLRQGEVSHTYSWGSNFPVHRPLACSGSLGHGKYRSSCQSSPMSSICRKPLPRVSRVRVEFNIKKTQFCIRLSWDCTKILGAPKSSRVMAAGVLAWAVQRIWLAWVRVCSQSLASPGKGGNTPM